MVDFGWGEQEDAYVSDDNRASMSLTSGVHLKEAYWLDYGLNIPPSTINAVWVAFEHLGGHVNDTCYVRFSWNGGADFTSWLQMPLTQFEVFFDEDVTSLRNWTYTDFTDANFVVDAGVHIYATGCYHPDSEVGMWEEKTIDFNMDVKRIADVKKGDVILGFNMTSGEYIPNVMLADANIIKGETTFYRIIAEYPMKYWDKAIYPWNKPDEVGYKDVCVTPEQRIFTVEKGYIPASDVEVGMHFHGLFRQEGRMVIIPVPITEIQTFKGDVCVTLDGTSDIFFTHYLMGRIVKTYYLDWLPVKVIYTPTPVCIPCLFIGLCFVGAMAGAIVWHSKRKRH